MLQINKLRILTFMGLAVHLFGNLNTSTGAEQNLCCKQNNLGIPFVDVSIEGKPMTFMVDSGSTNIAIDRTTSERLQLNLPVNEKIKQPFEIVTCQFDMIGLQPQNSSFDAALIDLRRLSQQSSVPVHGIMGMSFLRDKSLRLSPKHTVLASEGSTESGSRLVRCECDASGRLYVRVSIGVENERVETMCLIDSGMNGELSINYDCLRTLDQRAFVKSSDSSVLNTSFSGSEIQTQAKTMQRLKTVKIGDVELVEVEAYGSDKSKIGIGLLRRLNCTIHFGEHCVEIHEPSLRITRLYRHRTPIPMAPTDPTDRQAEASSNRD